MVIFSKTGVSAAAAKYPSEFKTPLCKEFSDTSSKYGNVMRDMMTAALNLAGSSTNPGAWTRIISGMAISAIAVNSKTT